MLVSNFIYVVIIPILETHVSIFNLLQSLWSFIPTGFFFFLVLYWFPGQQSHLCTGAVCVKRGPGRGHFHDTTCCGLQNFSYSESICGVELYTRFSPQSWGHWYWPTMALLVNTAYTQVTRSLWICSDLHVVHASWSPALFSCHSPNTCFCFFSMCTHWCKDLWIKSVNFQLKVHWNELRLKNEGIFQIVLTLWIKQHQS